MRVAATEKWHHSGTESSKRRGGACRTQRELEPWWRLPGRNGIPEVIFLIKEARRRKTDFDPPPPSRLLAGWDLTNVACRHQPPTRKSRAQEGRAGT